MNVFGGILESASLSVHVYVDVSVCLFFCVQNTSNFVSQTPPTVLLNVC